jgi:hypothetical protein
MSILFGSRDPIEYNGFRAGGSPVILAAKTGATPWTTVWQFGQDENA